MTNKLLIGPTLLIVVGLMVGSAYFAGDPFMWFASTEPMYQYIRLALVLILVSLLITDPPRSLWFRSLLAVCALTIVALTLYGVQIYEINLVDAVVFIEVALIFAIETLELPMKRLAFSPRRLAHAK